HFLRRLPRLPLTAQFVPFYDGAYKRVLIRRPLPVVNPRDPHLKTSSSSPGSEERSSRTFHATRVLRLKFPADTEKHTMQRSPRTGLVPIWTFCCLASAANFAFGQAAIPVVSGTSPQGAAPGQTVDVKLRGGNLAGPAQLWTSFPVESVLPADIAGNGTNAGE